MRLSWNEIRLRASEFSKEYADASYEKGETQAFYEAFFNVFGIKRRRVATYEARVKKLNDKQGYIDLFWPRVLLVEQKSAGRDLDKAYQQALEYCDGLKQYEFPRYILISDFQTFELYDLEDKTINKFKLEELHEKIELFGFILGVEKHTFKDQDPVNIEASVLMGNLHDALLDSGFKGTDLEKFLVRILFCLFADDTGIFDEKGMFLNYLLERTSEDGSDLGPKLAKIFDILDTKKSDRQTNLDEDLVDFPYVNGSLFSGSTRIPDFDSNMREKLIKASSFNWEKISPAIFGSLFQSVMDKDKRREFGEHYTSEQNILKVITGLFLDELRAEFERAKKLKRDKDKVLKKLNLKISEFKILDPACGCGNFLIIAYRELRQLEIDILRELYGSGQMTLDTSYLSTIDVDQFYGIEQDEFASKIAEVALWMMDHIMNNQMSLEFGNTFLRIPLKKSPTIINGNALEIDWKEVINPNDLTFILGNPPFVGHQWRSKVQVSDMNRVWGKDGKFNRLDYVTCWFNLASKFMSINPKIKSAFVSTNSIVQGEQASALWPFLWALEDEIDFAHRTFRWSNEAKGVAAVHCVIIGFSKVAPNKKKFIFDYKEINGDPIRIKVDNVNGYLVNGTNLVVESRQKPRKNQLKMTKGSQPTDGARIKDPEGNGYITRSNLILSDEDKSKVLSKELALEKYLKLYIGSEELINNKKRWCLWLKNVSPKELKSSKVIEERLERVKEGRLLSPTKSVREFATTPWLFTQDRQPDESYLAVPEVSSETRDFIPMDFLSPDIIASNKLMMIPGAPLPYLTILSSTMHMSWVRTVAGRLKSDYSYSPSVFYSFPLPDGLKTNAQSLEKLGQELLDTRAQFKDCSLADLYDPSFMPKELRTIHSNIDKFVDKLYRKEKFETERERVEYLFALFEEEQKSKK